MNTPKTNNPQEINLTSIDRAERHRWRFSECNGFIVRDWTGIDKGGDPVVSFLPANDIWEFLDTVDRSRKITVFSIGPCVLDWS